MDPQNLQASLMLRKGARARAKLAGLSSFLLYTSARRGRWPRWRKLIQGLKFKESTMIKANTNFLPFYMQMQKNNFEGIKSKSVETRTPSVGISRGHASALALALAPESFQSRPRKKTEKQLRFVVEAIPLGEEGSLRRPQGCCEGHIH